MRKYALPVFLAVVLLSGGASAASAADTGDDYGPVVKQWIADNQEWVDGLTA